MKKLIFLLFLPLFTYSQQKDSLRQLYKELDYTKLCLREAHKGFKQGVIVTVSGIVVGNCGILITTLSEDSYKTGNALIIIGSITSICGIIKIVDSHKWIGRGGLYLRASPTDAGFIYRIP